MIPQRQDNDDQSVARKIAAEQAKRLARKHGKKLLKGALKKAGRAIASAIAKALIVAFKAILAFLAGSSLPVIIAIFIFIAVIVGFMVLSNLYIAQDGRDLNEQDTELYQYMKKTNEETVTIDVLPAGSSFDSEFKAERARMIEFMSESLKKRYKAICKRKGYDDSEFKKCMRKMPEVVINKAPDERESYEAFKTPMETLGAVLQKHATAKESTTFENKQLLKDLIVALHPKIKYYRFTELIQTRSWVCHKDKDGSRSCGWEYSTSEVIVDKIAKVDSWNSQLTKEYDSGRWTPWSGNSRRYYFPVKSSRHEIDYSRLDYFLTSDNFLDKDKVLVEAFFEIAAGHGMGYTKWLVENGLLDPSNYRNVYNGGGGFLPGSGVPPQYYNIYVAAGKRYNVPWYYIAAIHYIETGFSTNLSTSSAGAIGHTQWMKCTWVGWSYPGCKGTNGNVNVPLNILTDLSKISSYSGYGVDGNGDGKADPMTIEDSLFATASYLSKNGINSDAEKAIHAYNHSMTYVNNVMQAANRFKTEGVYAPQGGDLPPMTSGYFMRPTTGKITSPYKPPHRPTHYGVDIGKGGRSGDVPIVAVADGKVVKSYLSGSYGNCVILEHSVEGRKYQTLYAHMTFRAVSGGQTVKKGQLLGNMGNTGDSDGAHLHFEVHSPAWAASKSNSIDPQRVIPF